MHCVQYDFRTWCVEVVFDRMDGELNETVVYTNDAIRPMFLIVFD
jgi:hypothetical protein